MARHVVFLWPGLQDYTARSIRAAAERAEAAGDRVSLVATPPNVPVEGMEASFGRLVHWIDEKGRPTFRALGLPPPDVVFQGGYHVRSIRALGDEARRASVPVILLLDNNWQGTLRQRVLDPVRHRLFLRRKFAGVLVPGRSARRYALHLGYSSDRVETGMYASDPTLFLPGPPLHKREKRLFFVGQFIARKDVLGLASAFVRIADDAPDWTLVLCGSGPQVDEIPRHPRIRVEGFVQPAQLSVLLASARALVLPSFREHWGLVVHEAAMSGCALVLSDTVGAADDLATPDNAVLFPAGDTAALGEALTSLLTWDDARWRRAEVASLNRARHFSPAAFADAVERLVGAVISTTRRGAGS